ncbi:Fc.00g073270.m01.CDS01, partial [Cosmosporella sp. VM-42]
MQVTPTSGGKSLTFILPAFYTPTGVTIVISPLVALQNDMDVRCAKMGIDAYVWKSRGIQRAASLVFVTPESAVSKGFQTFVERMHGQQKLDRVVVDECHTVLQFSKTFRPQIGRLGETLQDFGVPVICLTATLKPTQEAALFAALRFNPARVRMFREPTSRRNIQYRVDIIKEAPAISTVRMNTTRKRRQSGVRHRVNHEGEEIGEADEAMQARVCEIVRSWTAAHENGKVIVYGGTIERVQGISEALGCIGYWRGVGNGEEKAQRIEEWRHSSGGESGWIVATNALGLGVDVPDVRLVVHAGMPRQLVDLVQESGRGGRDGQKSESIVVIQQSWLEQQTKGAREEQNEWSWDADVVEFAIGQRCRREILDREMDGSIERFGCVKGEEAVCDVCQQQGKEGQGVIVGIAEAEAVVAVVEAEAEAVVAVVEAEAEAVVAVVGAEAEAVVAVVEAEAEAVVEADYQHSQRLIRQVETERRLQVMKEAQEVDGFEDILADWNGCCVVCRIEGHQEHHHDMEQCPARGSEKWETIQNRTHTVYKEMFTRR